MKNLLKTYCLTLTLLFFHFFLIGQNDSVNIYTYGGPDHDHCRSIDTTGDGGYIIAGASASFGSGNTDIYLLKVDSALNYEWSKAIGGDNVDWASSVQTTLDGGYIITGYTNSYGNSGYNVFAVKTNSIGDVLWTKTYGGNDWDFGYSVKQLADSGFIICGETYSYGAGNSDVYLIRTNQQGDTLWTRTYGGSEEDAGNAVILSSDTSYTIAGYTSSYGQGKTDLYLLHVDTLGDTLWTKTYGGSEEDVAYSLALTNDTGFVAIGYTKSITGSEQDKDVYYVKTDASGTWEWEKNTGHDSLDDAGYFIQQLENDSFVVAGYTGYGNLENDFYAYLATKGGWWTPHAATYGESQEEEIYDVVVRGNSFVFAGSTQSFDVGLTDIMLVKTDSIRPGKEQKIIPYEDTTTINYPLSSHSAAVNAGNKKMMLYPNPASDRIFLSINGSRKFPVKLSIYDVIGRPVMTAENIRSEWLMQEITLKPGCYFYTVTDRERYVVGKGKLVVVE